MRLSNFFEGKFEGGFKTKNSHHLGSFNFNEIELVFLNVRDCKFLSFNDLFNLETFKTEDFFFRDSIKSKKVDGQNNSSVVIFKDELNYYSDHLYNVLLKNITFTKDPYFIDGSRVFHFKGTIYFQLKNTKNWISQGNQLSRNSIEINSGINIEHSSLNRDDASIFNAIQGSTLNTSFFQNSSLSYTKFIIKLLRWLLMSVFLFFIYKQISNYFINTNHRAQREPVTFKIDEKDSGISSKKIYWQDFKKNKFKIGYNTQASVYRDCQKFEAEAVENALNPDQTQLFSDLYNKLYVHDADKINFMVSKIEKLAYDKKYDSHDVAELVVTFIQSIPYYLVHDYSCEKAMNQTDADFLISYHKSGKPCLPNIPAGVQSPYQFIHNLKGDCDTRALLAYTIFSRLNIPSSIWISQQYGHSVIGIGLPSSGTYKNINGVRHYATELTAKGYQIGMISPSQRNTSNWEIGTFNNF